MADWDFKLLFDGNCPLCMREVAWLRRLNRQGRLAFEDITAPDFDATPYQRSQEELMGVIHGVHADGRIVVRMEVFRQAYKAVGMGWLLAPTGWPVLRPVFDRMYLLFAAHRVRLGKLFGRSCADGVCEVRTDRP